MALYLDEIWLAWDSPARAKQVLQTFEPMATGGFPWPEGVTLVAGPTMPRPSPASASPWHTG